MYPETNYAIEDPSLKKRKQLLIGVATIFVLLAIGFSLWSLLKPQYQEYSLTKTALKSQQQFGYLDKSNLYAFNGLAFTQTNVKDGSTKVLNSGQRLPIPSNIYWANSKGALLNFSSSFYFSKVEDTLHSMGEQLSYSGNDYTWYLDFKSNILHLVTKKPIAGNLASYSERDGGFYYVPNTSDQAGTVTPLHFYNVEKNSDSSLSEDLQVTDMSSIQEGIDKGSVLFTARDLGDSAKKRLYKIKESSDKELVTEADRIFPTNKSTSYVVSTSSAASSAQGDEGDVTEESAGLYDVTTKGIRPLDFTVGSSNTSLYFVNDKDFFVLKGNSSNNTDNQTYYSGSADEKNAHSTLYPLQYSDKKALDTPIIKLNGYGDGRLLVTTLDGNQELFGLSTEKYNLPTTKQLKDVKSIITSCLTQKASDQQYIDSSKTFRIFFVADSLFATSVSQFSKCVLQKNSSAFTGYTFQFTGTDPVNGRISTD